MHPKIDPPRPFLKDIGEPEHLKNAFGAGAGIHNSILQTDQGGFIQTTETDMDILAEFEEEQHRKGHFELLFPTQKNIEEYRSFFG